MRLVRILLFFAVLTGASLAHAGLWEACKELLGFAPKSKPAEFKVSLARPETLSQISESSALKMLARFRDSGEWSKPGQQILLKTDNTRKLVGEFRAVTIHAHARWEAIAFAIDRYLGTEMVPPALMLDAQTVAILKINGTKHAKHSKIDKDPRFSAAMTRVRLLDLLLRNGDRAFEGNLLISNAGDQLIAIDFDLSLPRGSTSRTAAEVALKIKNGSKPPIDAAIVQKLKTLNTTVLDRIVKEVGATISAEESAAIVEAAQMGALALE